MRISPRQEVRRRRRIGLRTRSFAWSLLLLLALHPVPATPGPAPSLPLLTGQVIDATTGAPVAGAHVRLSNGTLLVTDESGQFEAPGLAPGEVELEVSHIAYQSCTRTVTLHEGAPRLLTLALAPAVLEDAPVRVSAKREPSTLQIGERTLAEKPWRDVGDALRTLPGVQLYENGGPGGKKTVSLRGSRPDHVLVRVDGVPVNDGSGEAVDLGRIPLEGVVGIEVAPSVEPGAPGGVVDITTRAAQPGDGVRRLQLEAQSPTAVNVGLSDQVAGRWGWAGLHLDAIDSRGDFTYTNEQGNEARRFNNRRERLSGLLHLGRALTPRTDLKLRFSGDGGRQGSPGPLYQAPTPEARQEEVRGRADFTLRHTARNHASWTVRSWFTARHRRYISPEWQQSATSKRVVRHVPVNLEERGSTLGLSGAFTGRPLDPRTAGTTLRGEAALQREGYESLDHLDNGATVSRTSGRVLRDAAHATLTGEGALLVASWRLHTIATGRADLVHDYHGGSAASGDKGIELWPTARIRLSTGPVGGRWTLHAGFGSAVSAPSFSSRFLMESVYALGNPNLLPERVHEWTGGLNLRADFFGMALLASGSVFDRTTRDLVVWRRNWRGQYFPDNLGRASARGLELAASATGEGPVREMGVSITLQRVRNATPGTLWEGNAIPFQPDWYGNAHIAVGHVNRIRFSAETRFAGRRYTTEANLDPLTTSGGGLAPYGALDLFAEHRFPLGPNRLGLTLRAGVENVTGSRYELLDRMPMPGRTWSLSLQLREGP